jgi:hypothetical protein
MKILLRDFNAKLGRENIFKPTTGNESLHQDSNDNGVRIVNFATSKNLVIKCTMFPHRNNHKITRYYLGDQIENEMGRACSKYGGKERYDAYRVLVGKPVGRNHLADPGVDGRIILKWIFRKWDVGLWTGSSWLKIGTFGRHL